MKTSSIPLVALAFLLPTVVQAQQAETFGPWEIHYHAMNTMLLDRSVASAYDIRRDGGRAMLSTTILRTDGSDGPEAHPARVEVRAANLAGQRRDIEMQEIQEDEAIYYVGEFRFRNEETLRFSITVTPEGRDGPPLEFTFSQKFYEH